MLIIANSQNAKYKFLSKTISFYPNTKTSKSFFMTFKSISNIRTNDKTKSQKGLYPIFVRGQ